MSMTIDQDTVDARIHRFMARKSPLKTLSRTIADHLATAQPESRSRGIDITYEQMTWRRRRM